ncbi:hypothetical protein GN286_17285 [Rhodobacteraceae bacterium IMCC15231]|nr:hypothetical protein [Rhodobacteraceae bacterium IMCC15231]
MIKEFDVEILEFTKKSIINLDDGDWLTTKNFSYTILISEFGTKNINFNDLNETQLEFLLAQAIDDHSVYELLQDIVFDAVENEELVPHAVMNFCLNVFCGNIEPPRKTRSNRNDAKSFSLLLVAEATARRFKINVSRNDSSGKTSAFDYVVEALKHLNKEQALETKVTTTFNSLSRMRASKPDIAEQVDKLLPEMFRQSDKS